MATVILKNSSVAAKVPLPGDLVAGELAVNTADGKIYMKNSGGTVIDIVGSAGAVIKTAYEAEADTNAYDDAAVAKLAGIEAAATADQTGAEIKLAYEAELDTNAFTDAEQTKLAGIEAAATADQTASEILAALITVDGTGSGLDSDLLDGINSTQFVRTDAATTVTSDLTIDDTLGTIKWSAVPTATDHLVNKSYVDALVTASIRWVDPIEQPDFAGVETAVPVSPIVSGMYIAYGGAYPQTWGTVTDVAEYDMMHYLPSGWERSGNIDSATPTRMGVGFLTAGVAATLPAGIFQDDILEYVGGVGGNPTLFASYDFPHGRVGDTAMAVTSVTSATNTFLLSGDHTSSFKVNNSFTYAGGTPGTSDGLYTMSTVTYSAPNTVITTVESVPADATGGTAKPEIIEGIAVLDSNELDSHYGQSYTYNDTDNAWIYISGPGTVGAGTGLSYAGTTLNVDDDYLKNTGDTITGDLLPNVNNTHDLGAGALAFANVYATTFVGEATSAQYADLAEIYSADSEIAPGTVVCFGGTKEVTTCMHDMDRKVAGIVSTNPAYLMNSDADGVAVALTGRVPCKVSGSVKKGDMMVSDGKGGARAEENPAMGSVIGKALADSEGDNVIEVVVGRM